MCLASLFNLPQTAELEKCICLEEEYLTVRVTKALFALPLLLSFLRCVSVKLMISSPFVCEGEVSILQTERRRKGRAAVFQSSQGSLTIYVSASQTHNLKTSQWYLHKTDVHWDPGLLHVVLSADPLPPPTLCRWYSPFKKVLVISQCSVSFQQSAAGSTFHRGTAGSPTHTNTLTATHTHSRSNSQTHTHTHACTQYTQTLTHTPHIHHLQSIHASQRKHVFLAGCLSLRERTNCFEDLSRLSHTQTRGAGPDIQGKEEGFTRGHLPTQEMVNLSA